jgi:hypothetical protein
MSEHEHTEPEPGEREQDLEDLDVPEGQQEDVAGGHTGHSEPVPVEQISIN